MRWRVATFLQPVTKPRAAHERTRGMSAESSGAMSNRRFCRESSRPTLPHAKLTMAQASSSGTLTTWLNWDCLNGKAYITHPLQS